MSPEREAEFDSLLAYISFFVTAVMNIGPEHESHPAQTIRKGVVDFGRSKTLAGLQQAANDTVIETSNWNAEARKSLDDALREAGLMTVSEVCRRYASGYHRVLKRGKIRNETEYYLVNSMLLDQTDQMTNDERIRVQALVDDYENR